MSGIFKTYDIRGRYPEEINKEIFFNIGTRLKSLGYKKLAIGRDGRTSSNSLFNSFLVGAVKCGVDIVDLGVVTSPMLSFFCASKNMNGAMITASHNPKEYNGIKFIDKEGIQLDYDSFLVNVEKELKKNEINENVRAGNVVKYNILNEYTEHLKKRFNFLELSKKKIVIDCSNGVVSVPLQGIEKLGFSVHKINEKIDGNFPSHDPDQTKKENLVQLQNSVKKNKAQLGIMFDGDADRCAFVDEKGNIVPIDLGFLILALEELETSNTIGAKVLFDLRFSRNVSEILTSRGVEPVIMRVGNPFYKKTLHNDRKAIIAGEYSGHIMYRDNYGIDDPLYATLKMLYILNKNKLSLSKMVAKYKKYYSSGEISIPIKNRRGAIDAINSSYKKNEISKLDGISVKKKNVWFNVRQSNTENLVRVIIEGVSKQDVEKERKEILRIVSKNDRN